MSDHERSLTRERSTDMKIDHGTSPSRRRMMGESRSRSPSAPAMKSMKKSYSRSPSPERQRKNSYREREPNESRRRYRSHSRSRSPRRYRNRYSHSRSRSYSPRGKGYDRRRSHSRSPMSQRRRHENPTQSRCLGVFGLSVYTSESQINHIFSKYGPVERTVVVIDAQTGRSRGFCFVYFENEEDAKVAKEQCSGMELDGKRIRVDYSITKRAHTPTPGIYMGKPTYVSDRGGWGNSRGRARDRDRDDYYGGGHRGGWGNSYRDRRSPSPHYRRRRSGRSRSRSYSPRFHAEYG
ncbi:transformer-2 protein homolog alpha-like isoform X2 [Ctenocephalides felis]|uniref:transformer-2 protein homolog alpha-like isoform X2 n=1 Tax=Ctenocephalides felis TaxID=7515 RepID=UPI000E6E3920|nr:transformer-2 protein homolog alpha-like isoform X2 [Ctenocephalides felis]XP_026480549.1 transformer-2 protein homolog alpha-like isoform X2 [Ctenocephalides felis]